jgi:hypothetical protein
MLDEFSLNEDSSRQKFLEIVTSEDINVDGSVEFPSEF